jgi:hypothetical protein
MALTTAVINPYQVCAGIRENEADLRRVIVLLPDTGLADCPRRVFQAMIAIEAERRQTRKSLDELGIRWAQTRKKTALKPDAALTLTLHELNIAALMTDPAKRTAAIKEAWEAIKFWRTQIKTNEAHGLDMKTSHALLDACFARILEIDLEEFNKAIALPDAKAKIQAANEAFAGMQARRSEILSDEASGKPRPEARAVSERCCKSLDVAAAKGFVQFLTDLEVVQSTEEIQQAYANYQFWKGLIESVKKQGASMLLSDAEETACAQRIAAEQLINPLNISLLALIQADQKEDSAKKDQAIDQIQQMLVKLKACPPSKRIQEITDLAQKAIQEANSWSRWLRSGWRGKAITYGGLIGVGIGSWKLQSYLFNALQSWRPDIASLASLGMTGLGVIRMIQERDPTMLITTLAAVWGVPPIYLIVGMTSWAYLIKPLLEQSPAPVPQQQLKTA